MSRAREAGEAPRIVIAGGGTGGHLFPGVAVAQAVRAKRPRAVVTFVSAGGALARRVVPAAGFSLEELPAGKLKGARITVRARTLLRLPFGVTRALWLQRRLGPHVVVGAGGYASGPVALAAAATGRPVVLLEQNALPGATNRALARVARVVVTAFPEAARHLPPGKAMLLGNPVRPDLREALAAAPPAPPPGPPVLLVLGGSQGARPLNALLSAAAPALAAAIPDLRVVHQTGAADLARVRAAYAEAGLAAETFAFSDDLAPCYARATLVLCRAGGTTLAELTVAGRPALLVPYPHAADDHQAKNAEALVRAGGAIMVRQEALDAATLVKLLPRLLSDRPLLARMGRAMRGAGRPGAAEAIADLLLSLAGGDAGAA